MEIKEIKKLEKNFVKYHCENCDFKCSQKCDWVRHQTRLKHLNTLKGNDGNGKVLKKLGKNFFCDCGKKFTTNAGLWKHKKKCFQKEEKMEEYVEREKEALQEVCTQVQLTQRSIGLTLVDYESMIPKIEQLLKNAEIKE